MHRRSNAAGLLPPRQQSQRRNVHVFRALTGHRPGRSPHLCRRPRPLHGSQAAAQRPRHGPQAFAGRETPPYLAVPRRPIQRRAGRQVMPSIPAGALPAGPQAPVFGRQRQPGRRMPRQPHPAGERTARVLAGYRRTSADRGRGRASPFSAADLAAVLATCHRPRRRGRGVESDQEAAARGRLDGILVTVRVLTRFVQKYTLSGRPEPSGAHEATDTRATRQWICICGRAGCAARAHRPGWARRAIDARPSTPSPQGERGEDARPHRASSPHEHRRGGRGRWQRVRPDLPHGRPSGSGAWPYGHRLDHDALDLVDGDRVRRPVVELRRLRGGVPGDLLRVFERPPVRQIRRDPRRPERVAAGRGREIRRRRPPLDHGQDETPRERPARQPSARRARPPRGSRRAPRPPDGGPGRRAACRPSRGA